MKKILCPLFVSCLLLLAACGGQASSPSGTALQTATAQAQSTSAVVSATQNPYPPGTGTLVLNDPMHDNSKGYAWDEGPTTERAGCDFDKQTYNIVYTAMQRGVARCTPEAANLVLGNFAYEARLTIIGGIADGLEFRITPDQLAWYSFDTDILGGYSISSISSSGSNTLSQGQSSAIKQGLGQTNLLAIVVTTQTLTAYVNGQQVASVQDNTDTSAGRIGITAYPAFSSSDATATINDENALVTAKDVRVWKL
jgi:hypothetical protein